SAGRRGHHEPGAPDRRCESGGAGARARRLPAALASHRHPGRRRQSAGGVEAGRASRVARRPHQRSRCPVGPHACVDSVGRAAALVLASAPGPGATLVPHHRFYTRWPWICGPLFILETPLRLRHETQWTPTRIKTLVTALFFAPVSFAKIALRAKLIESIDI